uniref:Ig-like domain-containing protein n=1 Tax=Gallus gallus TaxID=9031 RepID=A0A8V0XQY5_CHICK
SLPFPSELEPHVLCLASPWMTPLPRPSLSLHPSQGVCLGDNVTLRCHVPYPAAWVRLYQYQYATYIKQKDNVQEMAEFSLAGIKQVDAVRYQCQYQGLEQPGTSEKSDPVELVVTGEGTGESRCPWAVPTGLCSISVTSLCSDHRYSPTWHFPQP